MILLSGKSCFVAFIVGAGIGSAVTYFVTKNYITKREQKIADDKIKSMKEYVDELRARDTAGDLAKNLEYIGSSGSKSGSGNDSNNSNVFNSSSGPSYSFTSTGKIITKRDKETGDQVVVGAEAVKTDGPDYTAFYRKADPAEYEHPSDDSDSEYEVNQTDMNAYALNEEANSPVRGKPRVVSYEEFNDPEYDHHSKVELVWYMEDEVLADAGTDMEVYDAAELIGDVGVKALKAANQEDFVYVRNPGLGSDYVIQRVQYDFGDV